METRESNPLITTMTGMSFDWEEEGYSRHARRFDEHSIYFSYNPEENRKYIKRVLEDANFQLNRKGYVFLDEVLEQLGFETGEDTAGLGWLCLGPDDCNIDFGISRLLSREEIKFMNNESSRVVLDFNISGYIEDIV